MPDTSASAALNRLRLIGLVEGVSFLVLLFVAMPLKYLAGLPEMVKLVGWAHGLLFVLFVVALVHVAWVVRWPMARIAGAFVASLVPFGTFVLDTRIRRELAAVPPRA
jgi:integral membrane protein